MAVRTIKIGSHDVDMVANGRTPHLYYRIFHRDFLNTIQENGTSIVNSGVFSEIAFIMAMQAKKSGAELLNSLKEEDFGEWLEQFEAMDMINSVNDIMSVYQGQSEPTSSAKKKRT